MATWRRFQLRECSELSTASGACRSVVVSALLSTLTAALLSCLSCSCAGLVWQAVMIVLNLLVALMIEAFLERKDHGEPPAAEPPAAPAAGEAVGAGGAAATRPRSGEGARGGGDAAAGEGGVATREGVGVGAGFGIQGAGGEALPTRRTLL